ncbi:tetratricopeptide repeat protein [Streptomyces sp. NPDC127098]|uniref:tetratricopeptide repeat protein n=1 Tax=Streptomyces sp. NPDC127098 TaxID=3347137 RepID=UPI003646CA48
MEVPCQRPGCQGSYEDVGGGELYCGDCGLAPVVSPLGMLGENATGLSGALRPGAAGALEDDPSSSRPSRPSRSQSSRRSVSGRLSRSLSGGLAVDSVSVRSSRSSASGSARSRLGAGLVTMPGVPRPDPLSAVLEDPEVPERKRFCGNSDCGAPVGRARAGRPGRTEGFCTRCGHPYSFVPKLQPGDVVRDQYEIAGCLAHGGLGWIYLAIDRAVSDRWVVLKGLLDTGDEDAMAAAISERRFLAEIEHSSIVRIYNFVEHLDRRTGSMDGYIVMEYVGGKSLKEIANERRAPDGHRDPLPVEVACAYGIEALDALGYLHSRNLLYCDFKVDNAIQQDDQLKLIDMGAVRRMDDQESAIYGTVGYQAPEVAEIGPSVASDLYTVARTLAVLTFDFQGYTTFYADSLPDPENIEVFQQYESFYRFLVRATDPDPWRRFGSAQEMAEQLTGVLREIVAVNTGQPRPALSQLFGRELGVVDTELVPRAEGEVSQLGAGRRRGVGLRHRLRKPLRGAEPLRGAAEPAQGAGAAAAAPQAGPAGGGRPRPADGGSQPWPAGEPVETGTGAPHGGPAPDARAWTPAQHTTAGGPHGPGPESAPLTPPSLPPQATGDSRPWPAGEPAEAGTGAPHGVFGPDTRPGWPEPGEGPHGPGPDPATPPTPHAPAAQPTDESRPWSAGEAGRPGARAWTPPQHAAGDPHGPGGPEVRAARVPQATGSRGWSEAEAAAARRGLRDPDVPPEPPAWPAAGERAGEPAEGPAMAGPAGGDPPRTVRLDLRAVALALPVPRVDPGDANAGFLAGLMATSPADLLVALRSAPTDSIEVRIRELRAYLEVGDGRSLAIARASAAGLAERRGSDWRVVWYRGLTALVTRDWETAALAFDAIYDAFPGELAPKLALAVCAEVLGQLDNAADYYELVWSTDPSHVSAGFGLARVRLAAGDRRGAVAALESVPETSAHYTAARVAAVRARLRQRAATPDLLPDLLAAGAQLAALRGAGLEPWLAEQLSCEVLGSALDWVISCPGPFPEQTDQGRQLLGESLNETGVRLGLERSYRRLARLAPTRSERIELVEAANRFRPRTWV